MSKLITGHRSWLLMIVIAACADGKASADPPSTEAIVRQLVAAQATSEFGVWAKSNEVTVRAEDIRLERGPDVAGGFDVIRGIPPRDHWHPYLAAVRGESVSSLGGFAAPDLFTVSRWSGDLRKSEDLFTVGHRLALLADEDGAVRAFFPANNTDSTYKAIGRRWLSIKPSNWPADTLTASVNGGRLVRTTLLSQQTRSYDLGWRATAFDFQFDREGRLISWSRRVGDKFYVSVR